MINAAPLSTTGISSPPPSLNVEPPTAFYVKNGQSASTPSPKQSGSKAKLLGGVLAVIVLIIGSVVGLALLKQNQDRRQQASEVVTLPPQPTPTIVTCPLSSTLTWTGQGYSSEQCTNDGIMYTWKDVFSGNQSESGWEIFRSDLSNPSKYLDSNGNPTVLPIATLPKNDTDTLSYLLKPVPFSQTSQYQLHIVAYYNFADGTRCQQSAQIAYRCEGGGEAAMSNSASNQCTLSFTIIGPSATPTPTSTPGATATPTATPTVTPTRVPGATATPTPLPSIGCNQTCVTNADCSNPNHICFTDESGVNRCRLESNPQNVNCQAAVTTAPTPTLQAPVVLPEQLPVSGPEDWTTWLKAGLAILGMGAALLLML